jgi:hypothetical protein
LDILRRARDDCLESVLVLEDDAIFRRYAASKEYVVRLVDQLNTNDWDFCFLGHSLTKQLPKNRDQPLVRYERGFMWAHCYAVSKRYLPILTTYLEKTMGRPRGHEEGGKMYIDGAFSCLRRLRPESCTFVSNPVLSIQRGSPSSIAGYRWFDRSNVLSPGAAMIRVVRDEIWRQTGVFIRLPSLST